ncbi:Leucine-rich repeat-containing protein 34 [Trichoplax sp. H2]|uniref:Leucine-rich repeat-containing protein 34 n=1 Tax=Trichoplax adhaerens TaxID=10228 RepID=B3S086_TRIAD|nr:hypothetical protein TRIADDRAFT_57724 [Trichoplax adhaerens]EDV23965.1 hypothetical protein TRIADDRAFT_57724 [Trichoplax adhaerens]RDD39414.1 Leucine-rich repeat-containing protein 34 [Trichoplax sp. H2]|eukprot:XP_002113491.1 hypothetical protein TRIADDRAFT_57724 [Trichoplax adhaerens]
MATNLDLAGIHTQDFVQTSVNPDGLKNDYLKICKEANMRPTKFIEMSMRTANEEYTLNPTNLLHLTMKGNNPLIQQQRLDDDDANMICRTMKVNFHVATLNLAYNNISDEGAKCIGKLLENHPLRLLNLSYCDIGPAGGEYIAKGIQMTETLTVLDLSGNKLKSKGVLAIAGALQVNLSVKELYLANTDMKTECVVAIATVLRQNNIVQILNIDRPLLFSQQEETTVHIANMLKVNSSLRKLHLSKHDIRDFGAERLVEALIYNTALEELDLSCNRITRDGAGHISKLLLQNTPLKHLNLDFNRIESDGAIHLSRVLSFNTHLQSLHIASNCISGSGLCAIADSLSKNQTLMGLYVWGNNLENSACVAFQELMEDDPPRLKEEFTDVKPYVVDGIVYLAELNH